MKSPGRRSLLLIQISLCISLFGGLLVGGLLAGRRLEGLHVFALLPDVVVLIDQKREYNAVLECQKLDIPVVSMLDTNCDPDLCDVPIPCNDDAVRSVQLIIGRLADGINEGRHGSNDQGDEG